MAEQHNAASVDGGNLQHHERTLKRGLKNRHVQLIALGGSVGTGLFLGIVDVTKLAGPSAILGYAIGGFIAFLIMRQLGEMMVDEPVAGSFSHFAYKYWGNFAGFSSGWNYWVLYVLVAMAELTAVGKYVHFWWPEIPTWVTALAFFLLINAINLATVRMYGEIEFWFAIIKVLAVIGMIGFGTWLLISGTGSSQATVSNLWQDGGFFPYGVSGMITAMAIIIFSFGGLELVGIAAAETKNPSVTIPKAINQVIYRILIFYIGALVVLLSLFPWHQVIESTDSPFVMIFHNLDHNVMASVFNLVILTAALSVYNSAVYCNSRMLFGLAKQGNGPRSLLKVDRRGVPYVALAVSSLATAICVLINYLIPEKAFSFLITLVVTALVINWAMISISHLRFRQAKARRGEVTQFKALWYPFGNWLCLAFQALILLVMWNDVGMRSSVIMLPFWLLALAVAYFLLKPTWTARSNSTDKAP